MEGMGQNRDPGGDVYVEPEFKEVHVAFDLHRRLSLYSWCEPSIAL